MTIVGLRIVLVLISKNLIMRVSKLLIMIKFLSKVKDQILKELVEDWRRDIATKSLIPTEDPIAIITSIYIEFNEEFIDITVANMVNKINKIISILNSIRIIFLRHQYNLRILEVKSILIKIKNFLHPK